eukprot:3537249-Prymnesium_polylepis.1
MDGLSEAASRRCPGQSRHQGAGAFEALGQAKRRRACGVRHARIRGVEGFEEERWATIETKEEVSVRHVDARNLHITVNHPWRPRSSV